MNKKIKIAQIIGKAKNGGVEACILNYYQAIDRSLIEFHFFIENTSDLINDEVISKLGGKVILTPKYTNLFKYIKFLKKTFSENKYDIVHSNLNSLSVFPLFAAKLAGIKVRIAHSHSTTNKKEFLRNLIKNFLKHFSKLFANEYFACSELAGIWLFGKSNFKKGKVFIVHNAIDTERFKFNQELRDQTRKEFGISDDTILLGNVGRLCRQKNQKFLLDLLSKLDLNRYKLLILGQGELKNDLVEYAKKIGVYNNVIFVDKSTQPEKFYNAFDIFLLPSLYEGLPVSGVEAQVNGLTCLFSDNVTKEVKLCTDSSFVSVSFAYDWLKIIRCFNSAERIGLRKTNKAYNDFDIMSQSSELLKKYKSIVNFIF